MMSRRMFLPLAACLLLTAPALHAQNLWKAGAASVNVTPTEPLWLSGYGGRNRPADSTLSGLYVKALALEDPAGQRIVLITMDIVGIDRELTRSICDAIAKKHDIDRPRIAIATSHTHSAPVVGQALRGMYYFDEEMQQKLNAYTNWFRQQTLKAVDEAIADLQPALLSYVNGHATFAVNRRNNVQLKVEELRAVGQLVGPVDYDVPVLAVRSPEGQLRAVAFGYACHATVLSDYAYTGDYPGFAQEELEKMHPGIVALFFAGCGADQNPLPRRTVELAQYYGRELALAVDSALRGVMTPIPTGLTARYQEIDLPFAELPSRAQFELDTQSANRHLAARAKRFLTQLDLGQELPTRYPYPVQVWKLGSDLRWVFLGGEVVVDYSIRLKRELNRDATFVAAYANDVMAYIPSVRVLNEGGYEGNTSMIIYGQPTIWDPAVEQLIIDAVHELAR